jgi:hypothetical protein
MICIAIVACLCKNLLSIAFQNCMKDTGLTDFLC